jgi:hypothetical protein
MADINLKDLSDRNIAGSDLFDDSENFMVELSDESNLLVGGSRPPTYTVEHSTYICSDCIPR